MSNLKKNLKDVQYTIGLIVVAILLLPLACVMASIELLVNIARILKKWKFRW